jgi:hypothetical protein
MSVPTPVGQTSSTRVQELSQRLHQTIGEFRRQYPMEPSELREAIEHAASASGAAPAVRWSAQHTVLFVLVVLGLPFVITAIIRAFT